MQKVWMITNFSGYFPLLIMVSQRMSPFGLADHEVTPWAIIKKNIPEVSVHYKTEMYQSLPWKFRPWVCQMELYKVATESFC
jgi:hypothetical protein